MFIINQNNLHDLFQVANVKHTTVINTESFEDYGWKEKFDAFIFSGLRFTTRKDKSSSHQDASKVIGSPISYKKAIKTMAFFKTISNAVSAFLHISYAVFQSLSSSLKLHFQFFLSLIEFLVQYKSHP